MIGTNYLLAMECEDLRGHATEGWRGSWATRAARAGLLVLCWLATAIGLATPTLAEGRVDALRIGQHEDRVRFVLEMDRATPFAVFLLADPYRAVIDLPEVSWAAEPLRISDGNPLIQGYRTGQFQPGVSRVVIDLKGPARIDKAFQLGAQGQSGPRLVIDLQPVAPAAFDLAQRIESSDWAGRTSIARATPVPAAPPIAAVQPGEEKRVVVLDPGHGGVDPGAIGVGGTYEKVVVLETAKVIRDVLEQSGRYRVVMTRDRDVYLPLRQRYQVAQDAGAELFLSIHADSMRSREVRGLSVYTLSERASDAEAAALAAQENKSDILAGSDFDGLEDEVFSILIDLSRRHAVENSNVFAQMLVGKLDPKVRLLRRPHREAGFAVLKSPTVPSVLVELGYLSNKQDERMLTSREYREAVARGMLQAIDSYFERKDRLSRC